MRRFSSSVFVDQRNVIKNRKKFSSPRQFLLILDMWLCNCYLDLWFKTFFLDNSLLRFLWRKHSSQLALNRYEHQNKSVLFWNANENIIQIPPNHYNYSTIFYPLRGRVVEKVCVQNALVGPRVRTNPFWECLESPANRPRWNPCSNSAGPANQLYSHQLKPHLTSYLKLIEWKDFVPSNFTVICKR